MRFLLLTKDGLILKKENSKIKKITAITNEEISYKEHYNFVIPLCQINNVVLLVTFFVTHCQKLNGAANENTEDVETQSNFPSTKTPLSWMSFGL